MATWLGDVCTYCPTRPGKESGLDDNLSEADTEEFAPPYAGSVPNAEESETTQSGPSRGISSRGWTPPVSPS